MTGKQSRPKPAVVHKEEVKVPVVDQEHDNMVMQLENFDADPRFGPCRDISRLQRWNNA
jgi:hypothetical protein